MKNTNRNSGSKSAFKPIIATSLALALGVSVASAAGLNAIAANATVNTDITAGTEISAEIGSGGLIIKPTAATTVTLGQSNIAISGVTASTPLNAYGIYVNGSTETTVTADTFSTLTVTAPTGGAANYIFANTGTGAVTFKNAAIVVGASAPASGFGIYNNTSGSVFAFGTATNYVGADGVEGDIDAKVFTGVFLNQAGTLGGTLNVVGGNGYSPSALGVGVSSSNGGNGANATGISLGANLTVDAAGLNLSVTGGNGGTGKSGGSNGSGGSATGIVATAASTVSGGDITINLVAGKNGGSTTANPDASLTAIDNQHATATLAFTNGVNVGVGSAADSAIALKSDLEDVVYKFGAGTVSGGSITAHGTTFTITGTTPSEAGNGSTVTGAKILKNALFGGNVSFSATGGNGLTTGSGGSAVGLEVASNTLSFDTGSYLTITAKGGVKAGSGDTIKGGAATGILLTSGAFDASKVTSVNLTVGDANTSSVTGVDIKAGTFKAGAITLEADSSADVTGIKLSSGANFSAGTITLTGLGKTNATSVTVLDLTGPSQVTDTNPATTFSGSFTADSTHIVGNTTNTTSATLIKNAGNSTIADGKIILKDGGLVAKGTGGTKTIIDNSGILNFGVLAAGDVAASNASLILGEPTVATNVGFSNKSSSLQTIDFGSGTGASTNFYVTGGDKASVIGGNLESATVINGTVKFQALATASDATSTTATGMKVIATALTDSADTTSQILGDVTLNAQGTGNANAIALDITNSTANGLLVFAQNKKMTLNADSSTTATGLKLSGTNSLTIQDNATAKAPNNLGLQAFNFNVGSAKAITARGVEIAGKSIAGDLIFGSGTIGNDDYTETATALYVDATGTISEQNIVLTNASLLNGEKKYLINSVSTTKITFTNNGSASGKKITTGTVPATETRTYGIYAGIADVGYKFGGTGAEFVVTGATGAAGAKGGDAVGAIIAENTFIEGTATFTVTGGDGTAGSGNAANQNGGAAIGIEVAAGKTLSASDATLTLTVDGGSKDGNGLDGDAIGVKVAQGGAFKGDTLELKLGNTTASNVTAIDLNAATFSGSFTADTTNTIGSNAAASATLVKNAGESTIASGAIKLVGAGLVAKTGTGVATIINNTGTLNFGTLATQTAPATNASLTIADATDVFDTYTYGFANNVDGTSINFGTTNFNTTGATATGMIMAENTMLQGTVAFNTFGESSKITAGGNAYGIAVDATGDKTLTIASGSSITLNVDGGKGTSNGKAVGLYIQGGAFSLAGDGVLNLQVGASDASEAIGYYFANGGYLNDEVITLNNSTAQIGNEDGSTEKSVALAIATDSSVAGTGGFSLVVGDGVLHGKKKYVIDFGHNASGAAAARNETITFAHDASTSNTVIAGTATGVTDFYGLYSGVAGAAYDFGYTASGAGTTFVVENAAGDAVGAIIAKDATFEGKAVFDVTAKDGSTAVGIRLDGGTADKPTTFNTDPVNGFSYTDSTITASNGTAIALQTTGTHTISGNIAINSDILAGGTEYIFQNAAEEGVTTFDGSLTVNTVSRTPASGVYGLYSDLTGARYDFGGSTIFNVVGGGNVGNTQATGFNLATINDSGNAITTLSGNVVFNVTSGANAGTSGDAIGFASSTRQILNVATGSSVKFNVDTALTNGTAKGMSVTGDLLTLGGGSDGFVFNVGSKKAQTVRGIELSGGGSINTIRIADKSVFGNEDYTNNLSVIRITSGANSQPIKGEIIVGDVTLNAIEGTKKYILDNDANMALNFGTSSISVGNQNALQTLVENSKSQQKYGLYSNIAGVSYKFGTTGATFEVNGANADAIGGNASGIILAADARFEGSATFAVTGGNSKNDKGGDAYGIQAISGDTTLTLAEGANLVFEITGGTGITQGQAMGVYANNGTLKIAKEGNGSGNIEFRIGSIADQKVSSGVNLDNGVFDGSITFSSVKASESAYGVLNAKESIIKRGTITFTSAAFQDVENWAVIQNDGSLTIAREAKIIAGDSSNIGNNTAGIYNNLADAIYNLGSLNLEVNKGTAYGIYSTDVDASFNVAAGSTVDISAVDAKNTKAFGGSINLNLASGKQTNVYLNTDGGSITNLTAGENAYIYLSGSSKAARVGYAPTLSFRTLGIDLLSSAPTAASKAVANTVSKGANFVVLADASRKNGSVYNADGTIKTTAQGSAYNVDGTVSTTGGSDRIVINYDVANMSSVSAIDSTLHVGLSSLGNKEDQKYVVLAQVENGYTNIKDQNGGNTRLHNLVTFNGLTSNGDSVEVQAQAGFDTATITIQRHDLSTEEQQTAGYEGVGAVYVSNLIANDVKIDANIADASVSAISANFNLMSANLNSLSKRMGELRNTDNAQGVWGRVFAGQQTSNFGIEQTSTYLTFQAGYDYNISLDSGVNYSGLALSYAHGLSKQATTDFLLNASGDKVAGNATASTDGVEVALYNSYISDMGLYSDSIVKFGYFTSDLNIPAQTDTYNTTNFSVAVSEEIGYRVKLGAQDEWFIDPQAELAYAFINGSDFTQKIGTSSLKTSQDAASLLRARVGAAWGYKFDHLGKDKGIKASLYLGTYYAYDVISGGDVNLETNNGTTATQSLESNGRFVLNVGTDVSVQDNTKFYVDFEKSFGSTMQTDYQVSVGVRYSFGAKDASVKKDEKKEAPLKVSDKNAENN